MKVTLEGQGAKKYKGKARASTHSFMYDYLLISGF
jgi:hypothetical protein